MFDNIYENEEGSRQVIGENSKNVYWRTIKVDRIGGIKQYFEGATFPRRGYCGPDTMYLLNQVKRLTVRSLEIWQLIFVNEKKLADIYADIAWKIMGDKIMKYDLMTPVAQELQDLCWGLLLKLGFNDLISERLAKIFSNMVEYDDAYRYRVIDIMSETTKWEMIARPRSEIKHLMKIMAERDMPGVAQKFQRFGRVLRIALLWPRFRKAFIETIEDSNFEKLQMNDMDFYWMCMREDYKYGGFEHEHRKKIMKDRGWVEPKVVVVDKDGVK